MTKTNTNQTKTSNYAKEEKIIYRNPLDDILSINFPSYIQEGVKETVIRDIAYFLHMQIESATYSYNFFYSKKDKGIKCYKYWLDIQDSIQTIEDKDIKHDEQVRLTDDPMYQGNLRVIEYLENRLDNLKRAYEQLTGEVYKAPEKKAEVNSWDKYVTKK
tara:strand:+ start:128 stop:607 length:480 start_codon:yes stop_codon:yes gene_type:complete